MKKCKGTEFGHWLTFFLTKLPGNFWERPCLPTVKADNDTSMLSHPKETLMPRKEKIAPALEELAYRQNMYPTAAANLDTCLGYKVM